MKIIAANWKLHKNPSETREYFKELLANPQTMSASKKGRQLVFFPSTPCLEATAQVLVNTSIWWGAQNCYTEAKGAFTGETSAQVVKDLGGQIILVGHSERRSLFKETDEFLAKKVHFVQGLGLTPLFCIGETLGEREAEQTFEIIDRQMREGLKHANVGKSLVVAYEPVWAIGTGKVATSVQVASAHAQVFKTLKSLGFSEQTCILYGGSVKQDNSKELISIPHVDGFLIGGASLDVKSYLSIADA